MKLTKDRGSYPVIWHYVWSPCGRHPADDHSLLGLFQIYSPIIRAMSCWEEIHHLVYPYGVSVYPKCGIYFPHVSVYPKSWNYHWEYTFPLTHLLFGSLWIHGHCLRRYKQAIQMIVYTPVTLPEKIRLDPLGRNDFAVEEVGDLIWGNW